MSHLLKLGDDPSPEKPILDVGEWALEKHDLLRRYISASWAARKKWGHRSYIDLFRGPGRIRVRTTGTETDGGALVAWRESLQHAGQFTQVIIGDIDETYLDACATRLRMINAPVHTLLGPATTTVDEALALVKPSGLHLAYLDPFNLEHLSFSIIERLAKLDHIDILVHFSVMDLQREIELDFIRNASRFDSAAPGWRNHVAVNKVTKTQARTEFVNYWLTLVKDLGFSCSREKPLVANSKNGPLYRMMFLMRHQLADKLWNDIAKPSQILLI